MKKKYTSPSVEVTAFNTEDIIRTSGGGLWSDTNGMSVNASQGSASVGGATLSASGDTLSLVFPD